MMKARKDILSIFQRKELMSFEECWNFLRSFSDKMILSLPIDIRLKHSQYTIEKHKGRTYLLYNTLYNSMLTLSDTEFEQYKKINFKELNLVETLVDNGFLIPYYTDEFAYYQYYQNGLTELYPTPAHYTVTLTTKCNARCTYCYEEGLQQNDMSLKTAEKFAELLINTKKDVNITWFGGEPLLNTLPIEHISHILHQNNVCFTSGIITNGSLLNQEMIETNFKEWNINRVQITIDGMEEEYLRRKCYLNIRPDIFNHIIDNIDHLLRNNVNVSVRLNTDSENREECIKVAKFLKDKYNNNEYLDVYPAFLSGDNNILNGMSERIHYTNTIYKMYHPELDLLSEIPKVNSCFFQQPGAFVIDTDGSILCCDRDIGKQKTKLSDVYSINNFNGLKKSKTIIPELRKQCKHCVYYPKCGGGCKAAYNNKCQYDACFMERYKTEYLINKIMGY